MINLFSKSESIGIIGGADGPTAIIVSSSYDWIYAVAAVAVVASVIIAAIIIKKSRKK